MKKILSIYVAFLEKVNFNSNKFQNQSNKKHILKIWSGSADPAMKIRRFEN